MKNVALRVIYYVPFRATILHPLTRTTVYGVGEKLVENLFLFFCLTSTVSPTLMLLGRVRRRASACVLPRFFAARHLVSLRYVCQ